MNTKTVATEKPRLAKPRKPLPHGRLSGEKLGKLAERMVREALGMEEPPAEELLRKQFCELAEQWRSETGMLSIVQQKAIHPAYQRIIGMGKPVLPLIFRELQNKQEHWLWALRAITGEEPAANANDFKSAVAAWLDWGKRKGYL